MDRSRPHNRFHLSIGFDSLALAVEMPAKSLHRMLSGSGNPAMSNIPAVSATLKGELKVEAKMKVVAAWLWQITRPYSPGSCLDGLSATPP